MTLLIVAWIWAALNTANNLGSHDFGWAFWLNAILMLAIPLVGIATSRDAR